MMNTIEKLMPIIRKAGEIILSAHNVEDAGDISVKDGDANFVTVFDVRAQNFIIEQIKDIIPEAVFIAEEKENDPEVLDNEFCFVIDPIDGTTNFIHEYKQSSISLAMFSHGKAVIGIVYNPYLDEMFYATLGGGAFLNGKPIHVSDRSMNMSVIGFGTSPYYKDLLGQKTFGCCLELFKRCGDLRRTGSAALDLANVAAGRTDGFFEFMLSPWDIAAGYLLVLEAGGKMSNMLGENINFSDKSSVIATNNKIYDDFLSVTKKFY